MSKHPMPGHASTVVLAAAAAAAALVLGAGMVGAALALPLSRGEGQDASRGALMYAEVCAGCHGVSLQGQAIGRQLGFESRTPAPPLNVTGHAWQHSDALLTRIVTRGTPGGTGPSDTPGMPAFADRLSRDEIKAVLAYVKSRWPANFRLYQAALNPGGGRALAALLRDPTWTFSSDCLAVTEGQER